MNMTLCLYLNDRTCHRLSHNLMDVNVSWVMEFPISNELEQLEYKLEKKILGFRNMQEKLEKVLDNFCFGLSLTIF